MDLIIKSEMLMSCYKEMLCGHTLSKKHLLGITGSQMSLYSVLVLVVIVFLLWFFHSDIFMFIGLVDKHGYITLNIVCLNLNI